ncbi:MAG: 4-hydroxy-2-oxovalerate aldolase [Betaproteobacteria bacterium]|nr:4-hydroxy-2-oxovalerate aldolase [Betaproteobacteria bacterium]
MILKAKLTSAARPVLGAFLGLPTPALVEVVGRSGFDFIILDGEHGSFSVESLEECLRAAGAVNLPAIVRPPNNDPQHIQAALDAGAQGVQVPSVTDPTQARRIVEACHFPPKGQRGFGSTTRAAGYGFTPRSQVVRAASEETLVIVQVENRKGVENLRDILAVDGVDMVFLGTSDLSLDYGYASPSDPAMLPLLKETIGTVVRSGKRCGIHLADLKLAPPMKELGVSYFTVASLAVIGQFLQNKCKEFEDMFSGFGRNASGQT